MARNRLALVAALACMGLGIAATAFWLTLPNERSPFAFRNAGSLALSLTLLVALTSLNLGIRWVRWHYLLRRFRLGLKAKDSLMVWTVTLPAIATPFYLGELMRGVLLSRRYRGSFRTVSGVWLVERISEALVLGAMLLAMQGRWLLLALLLGLLSASLVALRSHARSEQLRTLTRPSVLSLVLATALLAWALPVAGLWGVLQVMQADISVSGVVEAFGMGTLLGGLTGIPLGIGVTGSAMILLLQAHGAAIEVAALGVAVFRAGTAWYAFGLGVLAFVLRRRRLVGLVDLDRNANHFDHIAPGYAQDIPGHIVDRLLVRKTVAMREWLAEAGAEQDWAGLDIGCGHGWYAGEMASHGYRMSACDASVGQVRQARLYLGKRKAPIKLYAADARWLPYADGTFDFAYGVNVFHHLPRDGSLQQAPAQILRVLKPGGMFFLHEINTRNPLFRFYMGYVFPLFRDIDEGTENWVMPNALPEVEGAEWQEQIRYFSFLPDFAPRFLMEWLGGLERYLEGSSLRQWSSHYVACLRKGDGAGSEPRPGHEDVARRRPEHSAELAFAGHTEADQGVVRIKAHAVPAGRRSKRGPRRRSEQQREGAR